MTDLEKFVQLPQGNGSRTLRFLPPKKGEKFYVMTRLHTIKSVDQSGYPLNKTYHCHKDFADGKWVGSCIICEKYSEFWQIHESGKVPYYYNGTDEAFLGDIRCIKPVERAYYNVIDREDDEKPRIFSCGKMVHAKIVKSIVGDGEYNPPLGDISDIKTGRDFVLKRDMKGGGNSNFGNGQQYPSYDKSEFLDPSKAGTLKQIKFWSKNLHDLNECRILKPEKEMRDSLIEMFGDFDTPEVIKSNKEIRDINEPFQVSYFA